MKQRKRKKHRRRKLRERLVLLFVTLLFLSVGSIAAFKCFAPEPTPAEKVDDPLPTVQNLPTEEAPTGKTRRNSCYTILVSGTDDGNGGCDTNLLVLLDAEQKQLHCVSLPRDTLINVDWKVKKLNAAYHHGKMDGMKEAVSNLLGVPVDFIVKVDLTAFEQLVDAIGGVSFDVPLNMNYDDPNQDLHIHIQKGYQQLNGEKALQVVRFRKNNDGTGYALADIGRIETQQKFLKAVASQTLTLAHLDKVSTFSKIFFTYVETDLSLGNLAWMATRAIEIGTENITFHTLPGDGAGWYKGVGYYILEPEATLELVNLYLNPYEQPLTLEEMDILAP